MSFFIDTENGKISCLCDFAIFNGETPILLSLLDIEGRTKKVCADAITCSSMRFSDFDSTINFEMRLWGQKWNFKSSKNGKRTHTILKNAKINQYAIFWEPCDLAIKLADWIQYNLYIPITPEIVSKILLAEADDTRSSYYKVFNDLTVYCANPRFEGVRAISVNVQQLKSKMEKLDIGLKDTDFDWDSITNTEEYLARFAKPISEKLNKSIKVMFNPDHIDQCIFDGELVPIPGQVPLIQATIEALRQEPFAYLASEQGAGKTMMGAKANHAILRGRNYVTLVLAPAITLTQWETEIKKSIAETVDVIIIRKTTDFIKLYNKGFKFDRPTYILVGKETYKLDAVKKPGVVFRRRTLKSEVTVKGYIKTDRVVSRTDDFAFCPDCGKPLVNPLRVDVTYLDRSDFRGAPKKSNYKCSHCQAVLWQSTYDKTKKSSLARFLKTKKIVFDSAILDEVHQSNNSNAIIGNAARTLLGRCRKAILLSGTTNNGYSSSFHNLMMGLKSGDLKEDGCLDVKKFIEKYGTLVATVDPKDGTYKKYGRTEVKDSEFKEVEGVNPLFFTKYLAKNYLFSTLDDLGEDLPNLRETYVPIQMSQELDIAQGTLARQFKETNAYLYKMYEGSIIRHYVNNPSGWTSIPVANEDGDYEEISPINLNANLPFPKEQYIVDLCKAEVAEGRKVWLYSEFSGESGTGQYMQGINIPQRLKAFLTAAGLNVFWLRPSTPPIKRKELIEANKDKFDVFISNPKLVEVGINMQFCPTYVVCLPSYQVNLIEQAVRRGYRINSTMENRIFYLYYKDSIEEPIMERMQLKKAESRAIESNFSFEVHVKRTASGLGKKIHDSLVMA